MAFSANGEYLVGGGLADGAGVWRVEDGKQMATMEARDVWCLAVSQDGRWIAAGTNDGEVSLWDAKTFEKVFSHKDSYGIPVLADFSPDSTRLITASKTTTVWDVAARKKVFTLNHGSEYWVRAAKYSPQGDRIATAFYKSVRVWDSNDGRSLLHIPLTVTSYYNTGLLWSNNNNLFVVRDSTIKQLEVSTGSTVSDFPVPDSNDLSCIALPQRGKFIAYSTNDTVTFWDTSTHAQLGLIQHPQRIHSIALSPDDRFLAIGGKSGKITIRRITVSITSLWIMANLNNFLLPLIFSNRI